MDDARYEYLWENQDAELTEEEMKQGWHFCYEWDGLLIGPGMDEFEYSCPCNPKRKIMDGK